MLAQCIAAKITRRSPRASQGIYQPICMLWEYHSMLGTPNQRDVAFEPHRCLPSWILGKTTSAPNCTKYSAIAESFGCFKPVRSQGFPTFPFLERMATAMAVPFMKHNPASPARAVMAVAQRCAAHAGAAKWPKDPRAWHTADLGGSLHSGCGHTVGRGGMYESWIWEENLKVQLSWWWPLSSLCTTRSEVFAENAMHLLTKTGGLQLQPRTLSRQPSQEAPPTTPRVPTAAALRRVPTPQCGCHRYWPSIQVNCMWDSWCAQEKIGQHEVSSTLSIPTKPPMKVLEDVPNVVAATSYRYLDCRVPRRSHKGFCPQSLGEHPTAPDIALRTGWRWFCNSESLGVPIELLKTLGWKRFLPIFFNQLVQTTRRQKQKWENSNVADQC